MLFHDWFCSVPELSDLYHSDDSCPRVAERFGETGLVWVGLNSCYVAKHNLQQLNDSSGPMARADPAGLRNFLAALLVESKCSVLPPRYQTKPGHIGPLHSKRIS